ncbi:hypothetical protein [Thermoleophilum album]|uniref:hypothetical protein n=1 Tax=Thermoleophilum album TaxID=29539 RepID=UPI0011600A96|nr:hypothetical protein [Thermoleophilum album]
MRKKRPAREQGAAGWRGAVIAFVYAFISYYAIPLLGIERGSIVHLASWLFWLLVSAFAFEFYLRHGARRYFTQRQ